MKQKIYKSSRKLVLLGLIGAIVGGVATIAITYAAFDAGYELNPSWSPDGQLVVFECYKPRFVEFLSEGTNGDIPFPPSSTEICTIDVANQNQSRLTQNNFDDHNPRWSPDGTQIAFVSDRDGSKALFLMNRDGSNQRKIADASIGTDFAWSPDNGRIALTRNDFSVKNTGGLYIVDLFTGEEAQLAKGQIFNVAWSPLGGVLAYIAREEDGCIVHIIESENGEPITNPLASACNSIAWSPSGTDLAFIGTEANENVLMKLNLQTQAVIELPVTENLLEGTLSWTSDASGVFYLTSDNRIISINEIVTNSLQQRTIVSSQHLLVHQGKQDYSLSPDGKHLVFVLATGRNGNAQIWHQILDGMVQVRLSR